jgi:CelD/BcsL family acetyltransferase involved in cellulose biosynthesis/dTDP-4-amino-4,6-dideoxygalactose transaminase
MYVSAWPTLNPWALRPGNAAALPFPLSARDSLSTHVARSAIYHLFRALDLGPKEAVLVPDYHHGNEVRAIRAAGARVIFYPIGRDLSPDLDTLRRIAKPECRVLFTIHYLGWPQPIEELATLAEERGMILVEDCALALLSERRGRALGSFGQHSVFCLYKTLPVPNGGLWVRNAPLHTSAGPLDPADFPSVATRSAELMIEGLRVRMPRLGELLASGRKLGGRVLDALGVDRVAVGDTGFDLSTAGIGMSALTERLLPRFDYDQIRAIRRRNFEHLRTQLDGRGAELPLDLELGTCPLFYPLLVADKRAVADRLRDEGIQVVEFWNQGDPEADGPDVEFLRRHVLEVPIHQDLDLEQVDAVANKLIEISPWLEPRRKPRRDRTPEVSLVRGAAIEIGAIGSEWQGLLDEMGSEAPFQRPEFISAYVEAFEPPGSLVLITVRESGRLRAVLPLIDERASCAGLPVRRLRGAANHHSGRFDLVLAPDASLAVRDAVARAIRDLPGWDVLVLPDVPIDGAFSTLIERMEQEDLRVGWWESVHTPIIPLPEFEPKPKLLANLRRRRKKLEQLGSVRFRTVREADPSVLDAFYALEASGWKGRERTAIVCDPKTRNFYDAIAKLSASRGELTLHLLELEGTPVAMHFGLTTKSRYYLPKIAYDERYSACSPGQLLTWEVIEAGRALGLTHFDFLGPSMEWKREWTDQVLRHGFWHLFRPGLYGSLVRAAKFRSGTVRRPVLAAV